MKERGRDEELLARLERQAREALDRTSLELYGLAGFAGFRYLGDVESVNSIGLYTVELAHEPHLPDDPDDLWAPSRRWLSVVSVHPEAVRDIDDALRHWWERSDLEGAAPQGDGARTVAVLVDGVSESLELVGDSTLWVAVGRIGAQPVQIVGGRWPSGGIRLTRVTELAPYHAGREELLRRAR